MLKFYLWLSHATYRLIARFDADGDEQGSVTTEHVLWAVAVIAIVGVVVAAIKAYVTSQAGNIK